MIKLYGYWRSSASYRVRIALGLKGVDYQYIPVNLRQGAQKQTDHLARNPQGFVPVLELEDGTLLTQSLPIIEYIDTVFSGPKLKPEEPVARAKVMSAAMVIAADISPIQNLSVLKKIGAEFGANETQTKDWALHWIRKGFEALEPIASRNASEFLHSDAPTIFEACLIPQVYNARRFGLNMENFPALTKIDARCMALKAFKEASPQQQIDARNDT